MRRAPHTPAWPSESQPFEPSVCEARRAFHYDAAMKDPLVPQVRVEAELDAKHEPLLPPSQTLTDFSARCDTSLAEYDCTGVSIPAAQVIAKLESSLAKRRMELGG